MHPIYLVQVVVEIGLSSTEVSTQKSSVGGEHRGHVHVSRSQSDQPDTRLPLVTMHDHPGRDGRVFFGRVPVSFR